jgi:hypothetical protein
MTNFIAGLKLCRLFYNEIINPMLDYLGFDNRDEIKPADWLTFPEQKLRAVISGDIFRADLGLQASRERFRYYPHDVWLYLMSAQWQR